MAIKKFLVKQTAKQILLMVSSTTAVCASKHIYKTVVMSTDAAHSLGDSLA